MFARARSCISVAVLVALSACGPAGPATTPTDGLRPSELGFRRVQAATSAPAADATVVVVFASWCGACRAELALLGALQAERPEVRIVGVNAYEDWEDLSSEDELRRFLADSAPWMTEVVRADDALLETFGGVPKIPTVFVYDRRGEAVAEFRREDRAPPNAQELRDAVARASAR